MANPLDHPGPQSIRNLSTVRAWPAPWAFSVLILPLGMYIGFIWTALPFLLSKSGVAVEDISRMAAILQIPPMLMFLWTPVVDVKLRRRTWLLLAAATSATCVFLACPLIGPSHFKVLVVLLFFSGALLSLVFTTNGGLMATTLPAFRQSKAAAWNQAGNFGGGVLGAAVVLWLAQRVSLPVIGLAMAGLMLAPALLALTISEPPPVFSHWFRGRLREMGREGLALLRSPRRRWSVLLMIAPGCTCAAQPLLPALASHYGVDAKGVLWINGIVGGIVLSAGSLLGLLIPGDWDRRLTYAGAGFTNAIGAIILLAPNRPFFYLAGTLVYLLTAGFCNARVVALMLDVVGPDIRDVSTVYGALTAISQIPIVSMIWVEGRMFHHFGTHGLLWTDAAGNLFVFAIVATAFLSRRSQQVRPVISSTTEQPGSGGAISVD